MHFSNMKLLYDKSEKAVYMNFVSWWWPKRWAIIVAFWWWSGLECKHRLKPKQFIERKIWNRRWTNWFCHCLRHLLSSVKTSTLQQWYPLASKAQGLRKWASISHISMLESHIQDFHISFGHYSDILSRFNVLDHPHEGFTDRCLLLELCFASEKFQIQEKSNY